MAEPGRPMHWHSVYGYKKLRVCGRCSQKFTVTHGLQAYCEKCRSHNPRVGSPLSPTKDSRGEISHTQHYRTSDSPAILNEVQDGK